MNCGSMYNLVMKKLKELGHLLQIVRQFTMDLHYIITFLSFPVQSFYQGCVKKPENRINREKINRKNRTKKKPIKPIRIVRKNPGSVRFRFPKSATD